MFSPAGSNTRSDMSCHSSESVPSTPKYSGPAAAMAITDLLMSEAQYLSVIKRVASSLSEAAVVSQTAARKDSATLRALIDQWAEIVQAHTKFHNDTAAVNDDLRETARLINNMNPEHKVAEWESALAQPFEHLASYDEWLQRVDPQARFSAECRARLNSVISKLKSTADGTAPQARNVFRRLSTMARGVIKRKSSGQGQGLITSTTPLSATESTSPSSLSPTTTPIGTEYDTTAPSTRYASTMASHQQQKQQQQQQIMTASVRAPMAKTVQELTIADNNGMMPASTLSSTTTRSVSGNVAVNGDMADTLLGAPSSMLMMSTSRSMLPLRVSTSSDVSSSMGTLTTLEASPVSSSSSSSSSTSSVHSKTSSSAETLMPGHSSVFTMNQPSSSSLARQTFLQEKENRKATLRIGTSELILAKAESLQSPTTIPKPAIEQLRKITQVKDDKTGIKPPVKSLINFWEQV
ncbi:hypothetical protein BGZ99_005157 [Dissophora globulifera]|uniref:DH domain-containing protein n=1 Tax=Dissophora globulifera TaxID=979702 RepID=A0A9P6UU24_9FUNG|nr:hypothetical protein BGZ99_005157 [Dissophora globulifera]